MDAFTFAVWWRATEYSIKAVYFPTTGDGPIVGDIVNGLVLKPGEQRELGNVAPGSPTPALQRVMR